MFVREARPIKLEVIVRGYITGSLWKLYCEKGVNYVNDLYGNYDKLITYDVKFYEYLRAINVKLERQEEFNYINDYPQDLYIYDRKTKETEPLITYDWFPRHAKFYLSDYDKYLLIGNYIADDVKGKKYLDFPIEIQNALPKNNDNTPKRKETVLDNILSNALITIVLSLLVINRGYLLVIHMLTVYMVKKYALFLVL